MDAYIKSTYLNLNMSNLSGSFGELLLIGGVKVTPHEAGMKGRSKEIDGGAFETS